MRRRWDRVTPDRRAAEAARALLRRWFAEAGGAPVHVPDLVSVEAGPRWWSTVRTRELLRSMGARRVPGGPGLYALPGGPGDG